MGQILKPYQTGILLIASLGIHASSFADHPNHGDIALSTLLKEAFENNIEIKVAVKNLEGASADQKQTISGYLPQIDLEGGYQNNKLDSPNTTGVIASGVATLNLYRGGKDSALRTSKSSEETFQKIKADKTKARIERSVSKKYYELLYYQEAIALKNQALEVNKEQIKLASKKKASGFTSQVDVLEFNLREATLKSDINLLTMEESVIERELRRLIGRNSEEIIRVDGHLQRTSFLKSSQILLKQALSEREDLKEAEKNLAVSELGYRSLLGDYLPHLDVVGKYGKLENEGVVLNQSDNYSLALRVTIPVFSGLDTVYGRESKSKEISKNDLSASLIKQEIKVQLENSLIKLKSIDERLEIEQTNMEHSKQYYEITLAEYKRGIKNSPDVAGAAERFFDSRQRNLEYRKDYYVSLLEVAEAVGISGTDLIRK